MNLAQFIACGVHPTQARLFVDPISRYAGQFACSTPNRLAAFLGQAMHESNRFQSLEESLFYRDPARLAGIFSRAFHTPADASPYVSASGDNRSVALACRVYANVNGNGDEASGDGWRFRGRGPFQLTGRANYLAQGQKAGRDWITNPDDVSSPDGGTLAAFVFFVSIGGPSLADSWAIDDITRRINPAMLGAADRRQLTDNALLALKGTS